MKLPLAPCLTLAVSACVAQPRPWVGATPASWAELQKGLARVREARSGAPWAAAASVTLREPASGRTVIGRGGIAVAPGRALRIIVVGVAGVTLLDAWVTPERWRMAVPVAGLVRRGGEDAPGDLPIGFLRWWFFTPLEGQLFAAREGTPDDSGPTWLLHDHGSVLELREGACDRGHRLVASRRACGRVETVDECRKDVVPAAHDHVRYEQAPGGPALELVLDAISAEPPPAEAFADPDTELAP